AAARRRADQPVLEARELLRPFALGRLLGPKSGVEHGRERQEQAGCAAKAGFPHEAGHLSEDLGGGGADRAESVPPVGEPYSSVALRTRTLPRTVGTSNRTIDVCCNRPGTIGIVAPR